jgi:hypothetical protein
VQATCSVEDPTLLLKRAKALFLTAQCHMSLENGEEEGQLQIAKASLLEACQISPRDSHIRGAWNTLRSKIKSKSQSKPRREQEWTQQCDIFGMERLPEKRYVYVSSFWTCRRLLSFGSTFYSLLPAAHISYNFVLFTVYEGTHTMYKMSDGYMNKMIDSFLGNYFRKYEIVKPWLCLGSFLHERIGMYSYSDKRAISWLTKISISNKLGNCPQRYINSS